MRYSIFEYLYRDAGNNKAWGEILLEGILSKEQVARMQNHFDGQVWFVAEQLGIPALREELWRKCGTTYSGELDHGWHEFSDVRLATADDQERLKLWGKAEILLISVESVGHWRP